MGPLRVAMLIHAYHPRIGGAERQLAELAPLLQKQNVDVQVLTRRYPQLDGFQVVNGTPVHRLRAPGTKLTASLAYTAGALVLLRAMRPQIAHAHGLLSPATTALVLKRIYGMPVLVTVHDRGPDGELARIQRRIGSGRRLAALRNQVDAFVAVSREVDQELAGMGIPDSRRAYIPNGVDALRFAPVPADEKSFLRNKLGLPDVPIAIYTGRMVEGKQLDRLIAIWPRIRQAYPQALLLLLGTGPEQKKLESMAGQGVQFAGSVENVAPYLQAADIFVLPSASEGLSVALLEAMATALPAVATAVGGNLELIDHEETGWLAPPDDMLAFEKGLLTLLGDERLRASLGQRARARILSRFQLSEAARRLCALYERLRVKEMNPGSPRSR